MTTATRTGARVYSLADFHAHDPQPTGRSGGELRFQCPECNGKEKTLAVNEQTGAYKCHRASCNLTGKARERWEDRPGFGGGAFGGGGREARQVKLKRAFAPNTESRAERLARVAAEMGFPRVSTPSGRHHSQPEPNDAPRGGKPGLSGIPEHEPATEPATEPAPATTTSAPGAATADAEPGITDKSDKAATGINDTDGKASATPSETAGAGARPEIGPNPTQSSFTGSLHLDPTGANATGGGAAGIAAARYVEGRGFTLAEARANGLRWHTAGPNAFFGRAACIVFPITDRNGRGVAVQGRRIDGRDNPKAITRGQRKGARFKLRRAA